MAAKTKLNKSAFIRQQPATMSATEVIAKGKASGMKISSSLVYMVRGQGSVKAKKSVVKAVAAPAKSVAPIMPATKATVTKADFVRSRSYLSPKEIVEDAKGAGLKLDVGYVYNVRGAAKAKAKTKTMRQAARTVRTAPVVSAQSTSASKAEDVLKAVAAELGLGRAMEILTAERARIQAVLSR